MKKLKINTVGIRFSILVLSLAWQGIANAVLVDFDALNLDSPTNVNSAPKSKLDSVFDNIPPAPLNIANLSMKERYTIMLSALQTGEINGAIHLAQELASSHKGDVHIIAINAIAAIERGDTAGAKKLLHNLTSKDNYEKASILLAKALLAISLNKNDEANEHLSTIIRLFPKHGYALVLVAHIATNKSQTQEAKFNLNKALEYYPNMRIALNNAGQLALTSGDYTAALSYYDRLFTNNGGCIAQNGKAKALIGLQQYSTVYNALQTCIDNQENSESVILAAAALNQLKQFDRSWDLIQSAINSKNYSELSLAAGRIALKRGDINNALKYSSGVEPSQFLLNSIAKLASKQYSAAEKQFNTILEKNKSSELAHIGIALAQTLQNKSNTNVLSSIPIGSAFYPMASLLQSFTPSINSAKAVQHFYQTKGISSNLSFDAVSKVAVHKLIQKANKEALLLGMFFSLADNSTLSQQFLMQASTIKEDFLSSYMLALTQSQIGKYADAETNIRASIKVLSSSFTAQYLLADVLMKQNKLKQAVTEFESALKIKPDAFAALKAGAISERLQEYSKAENFYRQAISALPDNFAVYNQLAWFFATQNRNLDEGLELAHKALELAPGSSNLLDTLGWLHYQKGSLKVAQKTLNEAKASSNSHSVLFHLGMVEKKMGNTKQAIDLLNQIVSSTSPSEYRKDAEKELEMLTQR